MVPWVSGLTSGLQNLPHLFESDRYLYGRQTYLGRSSLLSCLIGLNRLWIRATVFRKCPYGGMVDALVLGTSTSGCVGSSPTMGTYTPVVK